MQVIGLGPNYLAQQAQDGTKAQQARVMSSGVQVVQAKRRGTERALAVVIFLHVV